MGERKRRMVRQLIGDTKALAIGEAQHAAAHAPHQSIQAVLGGFDNPAKPPPTRPEGWHDPDLAKLINDRLLGRRG